VVRTSPSLRRTPRWLAALVVVLVGIGLLVVPRAGAAPSGTALGKITVSPSSQQVASGAPATYDIALSCAFVSSNNCGTSIRVTIPLDQSVVPSMETTGAQGWTYEATSAVSGLILSGPTVDQANHELVLVLNPASFQGQSLSATIRLKASPPNSITPNQTSWSFLPSLHSDAFSDTVPAPRPAKATATAKPQVSIAKSTSDGGSVYLANQEVTYYLDAKCTTPSTGNLYVDAASIVDTLPAGMTYVRSDPAGATVSGQTVRWDLPASSPNLPAGCASGSGGATKRFTVVARGPATAVGSLKNTATFSGTGPDATDPDGVSSTASSTKTIATIVNPPIGPGTGYASIAKSSLAPLPQGGITSGNQYVGTYPGDWVPVGASPTYNVGQAAASYQTTVSYGLLDTYQTRLVDPVPCLDNPLGGARKGFGSAPYAAATACANPAIVVQKFTVSAPGFDASNGLGQAYRTGGWRPTVIAPGSSTEVPVNATSTPALTATSITFSVSGPVGTIVLPPSSYLKVQTIRLTVFGYADASLVNRNDGLNELQNTATAIPMYSTCSYQGVSGTCPPISWSASLFTVPPQPALGIAKAFGTPSASGAASLTITGSVATNAPLTHDVVLTDWLPRGMSLTSATGTGTFSIAAGSGTTSTVTGTIAVLSDFQGSGRSLLRITIAAGDFSANGGVGYFKITGPSKINGTTGGLTVKVPTVPPALYPNAAQIFLSGLGSNHHISQACATPTQTSAAVSTATYENDNSNDLAGDGELAEGYCQNTATLAIKSNGAAFSLGKTVQGDLDPAAKGPLEVGQASKGGSGLYRIDWANVGSDTMKDVYVYDILPYVGDTGVSQLQSLVPRGSQFRPTFVSANSLDPGVVVQYSTSENPCRDQVYPNADNPGCVDDWTPLAPADAASVRAVRFYAPGPYAFGQGFASTITVAVPLGEYNKVAWNSAATNATDLSSPSTQTLPAEPPKVGIETTTQLQASSQVSTDVVKPGDAIHDAITLKDLGNNAATLDWTLYGPLPSDTGSCSSLDWNQAPIHTMGTLSVTNDSTTDVGPVTLEAVGCYTWGYAITTAGPTTTTIVPGQPSEDTLVEAHSPTMVTHAQVAGDGTSGWSLHDRVVLDQTGISPTSRISSSAELIWSLVGPLAPGAQGCSGLDWSKAHQHATGSVTVTGDGTWATPPAAVSAPGCYSFGELLVGSANRSEVLQRPGIETETVSLAPSPTPTSSPGPTPPGPDGGGGSMATTGAQIGLLGLAGLLVVLFGAGLLLVRRRQALGRRATSGAAGTPSPRAAKH
jgi:Domain of unknown function DUF11